MIPFSRSKAGILEIIRCLVFIGAYKLGYFRSQFSFLDYAYEVRHLYVYADYSRFLSFYKKETLNIYSLLSYFSLCYLNKVLFFFLSHYFSLFFIILWGSYSGLLLRCQFYWKKGSWKSAFTISCKNNSLVAAYFEIIIMHCWIWTV